jgi:hypothetical protein
MLLHSVYVNNILVLNPLEVPLSEVLHQLFLLPVESLVHFQVRLLLYFKHMFHNLGYLSRFLNVRLSSFQVTLGLIFLVFSKSCSFVSLFLENPQILIFSCQYKVGFREDISLTSS